MVNAEERLMRDLTEYRLTTNIFLTPCLCTVNACSGW